MDIQFNVHIKNANLPAKTRVNLINTAISGAARYAPDGFANFYVGPTIHPLVFTDVLVDAPGFAPYSYFGETGTPILFGDKTLDIEITLTPSFKKPSRDQIVNVMANFCNLRDSDDYPIFDVYFLSLIRRNDPKAIDWVNKLKQAKTTHVNIGMACNYNANLGWAPIYPVEGINELVSVQEFKNAIEWLINKGFIPIIKLGLDGQAGWKWGMENLPTLLPQLAEYKEWGLFSTGFDGCFPDWSRNQTIEILTLIRKLIGEDGCLDTEFWGPQTMGYIHMGNGPGDWTPDTLGLIDVFNVEVMTYPPDSNGMTNVADRMIKGRPGPYYPAQAGREITTCLYETCAYQAIRKLITEQDAQNIAQIGKSYGYTSFGNGVPL